MRQDSYSKQKQAIFFLEKTHVLYVNFQNKCAEIPILFRCVANTFTILASSFPQPDSLP